MTASTECRLLIDPPASGAWNMAVDQALLEWAAQQHGCCWRFYGWVQPTLSLGYFQRYEDRLEHPASRGCPAVRRLTGGGAIVHDAELTYSLVVPGDHPLAASRNLLYETVHTSLIKALIDWGVAATLCRRPTSRQRRPQPLLCFRRRAPGDVLVGPIKIAGSAQRRRRSAVLQHGSVLLRRSAAAPELGGLEDLAGKAVPADHLANAWLEELSGRLAVNWCRETLGDQQRRRAAALVEGRYASPCWTENRRTWPAARRRPVDPL
jgi:lipoate-protein ligase A